MEWIFSFYRAIGISKSPAEELPFVQLWSKELFLDRLNNYASRIG
ncbi:MAG: hypothetical protein U5O15_08550 [Candidatus Krumholzibacteriota bacterium]|nr:hypothetical protein [Candidatus Krumholzibacteriota bacterium]